MMVRRPRLVRRSLVFYLACFLVLFFIVDMLLIQYPASRRKSYLQATNNVVSAVRQFSNMEESVRPNQKTVILEPSSNATCRDSGNGLFLLFIVISSPENVKRREVIRRTFHEMQSRWEEQFFLMKKSSNASELNVSRPFQLIFFVGQSANHGMSDDVREEWERHGDVIVDDMQESYLRLTVKTLRMLKWVLHNCANAKYLVKMDDDVFVNTPKLFSFLLNQPTGYNPLLIAGHMYHEVAPDRDPSSKWFTPTGLWSRDRLPKFVAGFCYVLGMKVAQELFDGSRNVPLLHLEDVFLSGIVGWDRLKHELTDPGDITNLFLWYHNIYSASWPMEQLIIHQVSSDKFQCWTKNTGLTTKNSSIGYWPLFLDCL